VLLLYEDRRAGVPSAFTLKHANGVASLAFVGQEAAMGTVTLLEAEANLSQLVDRVAAGEEIVIEKAGHPLARLVPVAAKRTKPRVSGLFAGEIVMGPEFDDPLPEDMQRAFDGEMP
jgi:prevent-host-death family protein